MERAITAIVAHSGPSLVCERAVIEMRVALAPGDLPQPRRWHALRAAVAAHAHLGPLCNALESLPADPPGGRESAAEASVAMLAVCLQRVFDRKFDDCFGGVAAEGADLGFCAAGVAAPGTIAFDYIDPKLAAVAGRIAFALVASTLQGREESDEQVARSVREQMDRLAQWSESFGLRDTQRGVVVEARRRGLPVGRAETSLPVVVLGQGARQRWLWRTNTSATPHVAVVAATSKHLSNELLRDAGLPVPAQRLVTDLNGAQRAAAQIGYPVVVKPARTDHGIAVTTSILDDRTLATAFERARAHGSVVVEKHIAGEQHRLSVLGGRLATVARLRPAFVIGNGRDSISELVRIARIERLASMQLRDFPFPIDDETIRVLGAAGMTLESVPQAGQTVTMRTNANLSGGGRIELIDVVHPDNVLLAERAAATIGLDIAGIDLITPDVATSWVDNGAAICDVNPNPGLVRGQGSPAMIVDYLVPEGEGRIPIALVVAEPAQAREIVAILARRLGELGYRVAVARDGGVTIDAATAATVASASGTSGASTASAASSASTAPAAGLPDTRAAHVAVNDRTATAAVVAIAAREIVEHGLPFDRCALAVIEDRGAGDDWPARDEAVLAMLRARSQAVLLNPARAGLAAWAPCEEPRLARSSSSLR
ncbi:MAG: hypothetical protein KJZ83_10335 [Burkholderiaceae bacterium]|nr:hypothetical protein [Burkholderiaceae bacterium]